ncbi:MAG: hypothetical protein JWP97_1194 [Labilithrix sp.]|nr:hypothetical protein [Labilithrix sp.]
MSTRTVENPRAHDDTTSDRPSHDRVEVFLDGLEESRGKAMRTRWVGAGVGALIGAVALLTAFGIVPVSAENAVLSASAAFAAYALGKG